MKLKLILLLFLVVYLLFYPHILYGQSATSSAQDLDIKAFKEKIATKVAQLQKENNKAISGYITEIAGDILKIKTENNEDYQIKLDETLTKYYQIKGEKQTEIKLSDLQTNNYIIASGVINDKTLAANFVFVDQPFIVQSGKIIEIDKDNYRLKILTIDNEQYNIDIEETTKQQILNIKTFDLEKIGFSKIKEGDFIHFVAKKFSLAKEDNYSAQKILIIPQEFFIK